MKLKATNTDIRPESIKVLRLACSKILKLGINSFNTLKQAQTISFILALLKALESLKPYGRRYLSQGLADFKTEELFEEVRTLEPLIPILKVWVPKSLIQRAEDINRISEIILSLDEQIFRDPTCLGWIYQFLNSGEREDSVWGVSRGNQRTLESEALCRATQLFTDRYILRFLLENSLISLTKIPPQTLTQWEYLKSDQENVSRRAEDLSICDPACGTGHALIESARVLKEIGIKSDKICSMLFGFDIDPLAVEIARFSLWLELGRGEIGGAEINKDILERQVAWIPGPLGTLDRESPALKDRKFSLVVTNPPYAGRRKLATELRDFLELRYVEAKDDLAAAFVKRCFEMIERDGVLAVVMMDRWLKLQRYKELRNGPEGFLSSNSFLHYADLGPRAFASSAALHDGVTVGCFVAKKARPLPDTRVKIIEAREGERAEEKSSLLKAAVAKEISQQNFGDGADLVNSSLGIQSTSVHELKAEAKLVVGLQTGDDGRFVRYQWEVPHGAPGWIMHQKGGGYGRWAGLNRFVLDFSDPERFAKYGSTAFPYFDRCGWSYTWFANGALGVREKEAGVAFGRAAASGLFFDDIRIAALLNSRVASYLVRRIGGKIQLPEGVVKRLPIPKDISGVDPVLIERAIKLKKEIVKADILDVSFVPEKLNLPELWRLEADLRVIEGELDQQVLDAYGINKHNAHDVIYAELGLPCGLISRSGNGRRHEIVAAINGRSVKRRGLALPSDGVIERIANVAAISPLTVSEELKYLLTKDPCALSNILTEYLVDKVSIYFLESLGHRWRGLELGQNQEKEFLLIQAKDLTELKERILADLNIPPMILKSLLKFEFEEWVKRKFFELHSKRFLRSPLLIKVNNSKYSDRIVILYGPRASAHVLTELGRGVGREYSLEVGLRGLNQDLSSLD